MLAARADGARHRDQRRHSRVRRPHRLGADVVQGSVRRGARDCMRRMPTASHALPVWRAAHRAAAAAAAIRRCASRSCSRTPASKASQVGNAVGLDAPASLLTLLRAMRRDGYAIDGVPATSDDLMFDLLARGSYDEQHPLDPAHAHRFSRRRYAAEFARHAAGVAQRGWRTGGASRPIAAIRCAIPARRDRQEDRVEGGRGRADPDRRAVERRRATICSRRWRSARRWWRCSRRAATG